MESFVSTTSLTSRPANLEFQHAGPRRRRGRPVIREKRALNDHFSPEAHRFGCGCNGVLGRNLHARERFDLEALRAEVFDIGLFADLRPRSRATSRRGDRRLSFRFQGTLGDREIKVHVRLPTIQVPDEIGRTGVGRHCEPSTSNPRFFLSPRELSELGSCSSNSAVAPVILGQFLVSLCFHRARPLAARWKMKRRRVHRLTRDKNCEAQAAPRSKGHGNTLLAGLLRRGDRGRRSRYCHASRRA